MLPKINTDWRRLRANIKVRRYFKHVSNTHKNRIFQKSFDVKPLINM